jgi:integrase
MGRRASVRNKNGYWFSNAQKLNRYFGRCDEISESMAMSLLFKAIAEAEGRDKKEGGEGDGVGNSGMGMEWKSPTPEDEIDFDSHPIPTSQRKTNRQRMKKKAESPTPSPSSFLSTTTITNTTTPEEKQPPTVNTLADAFLEWLQAHRPAKSHRERSRHLLRFRESNGDEIAISIGRMQIEAFGGSLMAKGHAPAYIHKHLASVRMMMRWGIRHGHLPPGFAPFSTVEPIHVPAKALLESDLPTPEEVEALIANAQPDLRDLLIVYHATGSRTHELIDASVGDFQCQSRTIVLGKHKRSRTMREPIPRTITLSPEALSIVQRRCESRDPNDAIFIRDATGNGRWTNEAITQRYQRIRAKAKVRTHITIYSLRHLWISEALMGGIDILLIARMAGTSVKMIESVYGHFKTSSYQDAQAKLDRMRMK